MTIFYSLGEKKSSKADIKEVVLLRKESEIEEAEKYF